MDSVITASGPRVPAFPTTQRAFRVGFVLLVEPGNEELEQAIEGTAEQRSIMVRHFRDATGGRGEIVPLDAVKASRRRAARH